MFCGAGIVIACMLVLATVAAEETPLLAPGEDGVYVANTEQAIRSLVDSADYAFITFCLN
jgi:hypothetical protein